MSSLTLEITDALREALEAAARREHKSAEQVASESLTRILEAQHQLDYLVERARKGDRKDFDSFLSKAPDAPPSLNDKL